MTLSLTLALSFLLAGATVFAQKKGGGGSVPAGTIYYTYYEGTGSVYYFGTHRIDADGSNAAEVFAFLSAEEPGHIPQSDIYRADRDGSGRTFVATGSALGWRD
jgi:hypothetical protein